MQTINFGIDLGTTNSLIARFSGSNVELFKNPVGLKDTLPSCVAFRGERVLVGDKAREWLLKDPLNVFASFKRRMGTDENFWIESRAGFISPIELSALVLKELKNFIHTGEIPASVVITIPASFDTVQSNATKQAGYEAGFEEVVLLQEPIAASLAFFNKHLDQLKEKGKWLVYDLGGGTFDVALIGIQNNEMRVIDHQGDNYLGGVDFDHGLVMEVIVPEIIRQTKETALSEAILAPKGKYEKLYHILLLKAEDAKKELSNRVSTEIEFSYPLANGSEEELYVTITRDELNQVIQKRIEATLLMLEVILDRNQLTTSDVEEIILVGGSTYIPYVRETIAAKTSIRVNTEVDPTNAVAVGAAYFAGSKPVNKIRKVAPAADAAAGVMLTIHSGYNPTTKDTEEYISASVQPFQQGLFYRIVRTDGGYDSGQKPLTEKFGEFVALLPNRVNTFQIRLSDAHNNPVASYSDEIHITQGLFSLYGQPLPEDICIEVDDLNNNSTRCELIFPRNSILPITKTIYKELSRTIRKGSDDVLIINLMEGDSTHHPSTNKVIGVIEIKADTLVSDLVKGSDVEIKIDISESRDVSVTTHLSMTDQQYSEVFSPTKRYVSIQKLKDEVTEIRGQLEQDLSKAIKNEEFELAGALQVKMDLANELYQQVRSLKDNALTDEKYQLDESKRKLARQLFTQGAVNNRVLRQKERYYDLMGTLLYYKETLDDIPKTYQDEVLKMKAGETEAMRNSGYFAVDALYQRALKLHHNIICYTPTLLIQYYHWYSSFSPDQYTDFDRAQKEIQKGEKALERQNYDELRGIFITLLGISRNSEHIDTKIKGTGLG